MTTIDNNKLDLLLNELKLLNVVSLDAFSKKTGESFHTCRLLAETLVDDGHAQYAKHTKDIIGSKGKGSIFKGYVLTAIDKQLADTEEMEIKKLQKINTQLSIDKLEYEKTIRDLQKELTISSILKNWWWLFASVTAAGVAIGKYWDNLLRTLIP